MRVTFATVAFAALAAANPVAQGVSSAIAPKSSAPAGCKATVDGTFEIELVNKTTSSTKRDLVARDALMLHLNNGILTDAMGRIGSIVANGQFQFDGPPAQTGSKYTAGWALCANNTLALGAQTVFYQCLTSNYYNIYDASQGGQCSPVYIEAINARTGAAVTQSADGQPAATTDAAVTQKTDGQPQGPTGKPVTQYTDGQPQAPTGNPVTQYTDGQPQAPTGKPVSQISDGQPQAPTGKPVSQISDGQVQAPTMKPTRTGSPVSQISDGQPQAPTGKSNSTMMASGTGKPSSTSAKVSPIAATGAAVANVAGAMAIAAGVFAALI